MTTTVVAISGDKLDTVIDASSPYVAVLEEFVQQCDRTANHNDNGEWTVVVPWHVLGQRTESADARSPQSRGGGESTANTLKLADVIKQLHDASNGHMHVRVILGEDELYRLQTQGKENCLLPEAIEVLEAVTSVEFEAVPGQHYASLSDPDPLPKGQSLAMAKRRLGMEAGYDTKAILMLGGGYNTYADADLYCALHCGLAAKLLPIRYPKSGMKGTTKLAQELGIDNDKPKSGNPLQKHSDNKGAEAELPWDKDNGNCLTMHQPWASLLIHGIKRVEGRPWKSNFSGILWIHAAAREPLQTEIEEIEKEYRTIYRDKDVQLRFPTSYPVSCLLGCVYVPAVLEQQAFQELVIENDLPRPLLEESASHFVFLCEKPHKLVAPFSLGGAHKIWNLSKTKPELESLRRGLVQSASPQPLTFSNLLQKSRKASVDTS